VPSGELPSQALAVETAQKLLHQVCQYHNHCRLTPLFPLRPVVLCVYLTQPVSSKLSGSKRVQCAPALCLRAPTRVPSALAGKGSWEDQGSRHRADCATMFMLQGLKRQELRDELYMQLVKQTRSNPVSTSRTRAWALFHLVASAMPPSKEFTGLISEYVHTALQVSNYAWHWCGPVRCPA
jgi:hypothetical protein